MATELGTVPQVVDVGEKFTDELGTEWEVKPKCNFDGDFGSWVCVTHDQVFRSQFDKDSHIMHPPQKGKCRFAWLCLKHAEIEVP